MHKRHLARYGWQTGNQVEVSRRWVSIFAVVGYKMESNRGPNAGNDTTATDKSQDEGFGSRSWSEGGTSSTCLQLKKLEMMLLLVFFGVRCVVQLKLVSCNWEFYWFYECVPTQELVRWVAVAVSGVFCLWLADIKYGHLIDVIFSLVKHFNVSSWMGQADTVFLLDSLAKWDDRGVMSLGQ